MNNLKLKSNSEVQLVFDKYPDVAKVKLSNLRELIINVADETENISMLEETLKWGEPSYITKHGSTLRMDWKPSSPDQYAMYFQCTSKLVPTFRIVYKDIFQFEGNRAIVFKIKEELPEKELKQCIKACLTYHKIKQLPLLGL
ncbi:DUF1801 domain-containing protein [Aquimarina sp. D1M17]|uniref:DUF1801 domain-containing protein n=1 Tax=Aquimarina acroporae TaxID=2937283 RepID=UPI0020C05038|nr:DUF1801 domain-containing protein [Aquimarina acroporae]MCK8521040.1 DUF1801 domain-containing protein [Aquimarina acroporae]